VIPELAPTLGFQQHNSHHIYDVFTHTAHVCAATPPDLALRWAALLHDIGKVSTFFIGEDGEGHFYRHDRVGAQLVDEILLRLKAPTALREEVVFLVRHHMSRPEPDKRLLRRYLSRWGEERLHKLLLLQQADLSSKGVPSEPFPYQEIVALIREVIAENSCLTLRGLAVDGNDLISLGLSGKEIGDCLRTLLDKVLDEELPNEKSALLAEVRRTL
jgi:tRNA nucleotidyltransferase (CCA-adding enzyme)